ncbi:MAG: carbohydrate binding family 9 domain-containing protein [Candidatus Aminicenantes bacterium]|nr:carbohydrate binding family 9 domain-containing protein [Candidatus Aminicenantes bacterium]
MVGKSEWAAVLGAMALLFCSWQARTEDKAVETGALVVQAIRTNETIRVDGRLDEQVWTTPPVSRPFLTFSPTYGEIMGEATRIWVAYDRDTLYFAFRCLDTRPDRIKTSIARRDHSSADDWIGVVIDSLNQRQSSAEFYANPSGIQTDGVTSAVNSFRLNTAVDFVWRSAGRITSQGYDMEFAIPLRSLRFTGGDRVVMGMSFMRYINRLGHMGSWPGIPVGKTQFNAMAVVEFRELRSRLNAEVLPNFTAGFQRERDSAARWRDGSWNHNLGLSAKYGLTSSITAEATVNPDFSQVESDAFQVTVNQRYPLFFEEKRPFFMEGMEVFEFGVVPSGLMYSAMHTRNLVDPFLAAKVTGSLGPVSMVALAAGDEAPDPDGRLQGNAFWGLLRAKTSIGSDNSAGLLYSDHSRDGTANRVFGADLQYRFFGNLRVGASWLASRTREVRDRESRAGQAVNAVMQYMNPRLESWATFELYDRDFRMDSAFLQRGSLSRWQYFAGPYFQLRDRGVKWLQRLQPYLRIEGLHDLETGMNDSILEIGTTAYFRQSDYLHFEYVSQKESWLGATYPQHYVRVTGNAQLSRRFSLRAGWRTGEQLYYGPGQPFVGRGGSLALGVTLQPTSHFLAVLDWSRYHLDAPAGEQIYRVNIWNGRATYQFTRHFFVRGILRYDDYEKELLADFLASFTLIPGTVIHLGYGSLHQPLEDSDYHPAGDPLHMRHVRSSLFLKLSYLWRL